MPIYEARTQLYGFLDIICNFLLSFIEIHRNELSDKSWIVPAEFKMFGGTVKTVNLVYDEENDCFDYDPNNKDFCIHHDVYVIESWRFPALPGTNSEEP